MLQNLAMDAGWEMTMEKLYKGNELHLAAWNVLCLFRTGAIKK
jgi:hypothetical protein